MIGSLSSISSHLMLVLFYASILFLYEVKVQCLTFCFHMDLSQLYFETHLLE